MRPLKHLLILAFATGFGVGPAMAGFRSPESLIRNVYAHYGNGASELSKGLPRDPDTARQFFDHRNHAMLLFGDGDTASTGAGRLTADVDQVGGDGVLGWQVRGEHPEADLVGVDELAQCRGRG